jgi:radical SAM protein with 4Fe4S-binding SPASM domain
MAKHNLDSSTCYRLIDEAAKLGVTQISFGGGEPTSVAIFLDLIAAVISNGMKAEIFSCGISVRNATLKDLSSRLLSKLADWRNVKIIFGFLGGSASVHDSTTQVEGSFALTLRSLENAKDCGLISEINFVPLKPNIKNFGELVRLAESRGIPRINVLRFVPQGRGELFRSQLELSFVEEQKFLRELAALRRRSHVTIRTGSPFNGLLPDPPVPCKAGATKLVIQSDGNVIPCEVFKHSARRAWELSAYENSLSDLLASKRLSSIQTLVGQPKCFECPVHSVLIKEIKKNADIIDAISSESENAQTNSIQA